MRRRIFLLVNLIAVFQACASVCTKAATEAKAAGPRWIVDHYVYDAPLAKSWVVMVDCNHPQTPARMELSKDSSGGKSGSAKPEAGIRLGAAVDIFSDRGPTSIRLSGTAIDAGNVGQIVRVRIGAEGEIVRGYARSSHTVELTAGPKKAWSAQ